MKKQAYLGFAMIEILITAVILAVGLSGVGVLLLRSIQATQDTSQQSQAIWMVQDFVGRIRANPEGARAGAYEFSGILDCSEENKPAIQCADTANNDASECSAEQLAIYDRWLSVCGSDPLTFDSSADFVINPELTSTCTLSEATRFSSFSGNPDCIQYFIELEWDTKRQQSGDNNAERDYRNIYTMIVELN